MAGSESSTVRTPVFPVLSLLADELGRWFRDQGRNQTRSSVLRLPLVLRRTLRQPVALVEVSIISCRSLWCQARSSAGPCSWPLAPVTGEDSKSRFLFPGDVRWEYLVSSCTSGPAASFRPKSSVLILRCATCCSSPFFQSCPFPFLFM